jgi:hypothetical protein
MIASAVRVNSSMTLKNRMCRPPAGGHIGLEVEADHMHRVLGRQPLLFPGAGPGAALLPRPGLANQTLLAPEPAHRFRSSAMPSHSGCASKVPPGLPPAPRRMLPRQGPQLRPQPRFLETHVRLLLAERRTVLAQDFAREAFGRPELLHRHADGTAAGFGAQNFPLATSFRMSLASSLVRLDASAFFSDPYWFSHRYQVTSVIYSSLMTSTIGRPSLSIFWPCRTLAMTCSGVCLRAMIREFPPASILGHETHSNTGLLHGDPTIWTCCLASTEMEREGARAILVHDLFAYSCRDHRQSSLRRRTSRYSQAGCSLRPRRTRGSALRSKDWDTACPSSSCRPSTPSTGRSWRTRR